MEIDAGKYVVKCVKPGGDTLALYNFAATEGQAVDLLDAATDASIRAAQFWTAANMCEDQGFELAQKIAAGSWIVVVRREPDLDQQSL
jgi:hypothetical protein